MDTTSFQGNVTLNPTVGLSPLSWSSDLKQLTINPAASLENDIQYVLTIYKNVTDINGKQLDGNGDGGASEDFNLIFRTSEKDVFPPQLIYSNPSIDIYIDNFDVQDVFSFGFNELLDHASLGPTSTSVTRAGQEIAHQRMIYDLDEKSVLCIQTEEPLYSGHAFQISVSEDFSDTSGNTLDNPIIVDFETETYNYEEIMLIENFSGSGFWREPGYSGSTNGVDVVASTFGISSSVYLPAAAKPLDRRSGRLHYVWDENALDPPGSEYLLREYLDDSPPKQVEFDTTYILQCYVLGDGSKNKFRFALDDNLPATAKDYHEVSKWVTIDWMGWRVVEWDLGDPESVGEWADPDSAGERLGNGILEGTLRFDSFQLTHDENTAPSGTLYFSNLRLVKKKYEIVNDIADENLDIPQQFALKQNYPNPFNPATIIPFEVSRTGQVRLTIYNVLGQEVAVLLNRIMPAGRFQVRFDGLNLASGIYIYELRSEDISLRKPMILLK
jgi:hypothetical protein